MYKFVLKKHLFITQSFLEFNRIKPALYVKYRRINQQIKHHINKTLFTQSIVDDCKERKHEVNLWKVSSR